MINGLFYLVSDLSLWKHLIQDKKIKCISRMDLPPPWGQHSEQPLKAARHEWNLTLLSTLKLLAEAQVPREKKKHLGKETKTKNLLDSSLLLLWLPAEAPKMLVLWKHQTRIQKSINSRCYSEPRNKQAITAIIPWHGAPGLQLPHSMAGWLPRGRK